MTTHRLKGFTTMNVSPTSPHGWALLNLQARLDRARRSPERGASAIEWVIITAALVALAATVGVIIFNRVNNAAENINIPDAPGGR
jgi:hypothetical protein